MTWLNLSAFVVGGLIRLLKSDRFDAVLEYFGLPVIQPRILPWLSLGLGVLSGVIAALVVHMPWPDALKSGLESGFLSIAGHELVIESLRGGKEIPPRPLDSPDLKVVN